MNRVVAGSSLPTAENTLEATLEVPFTTVDPLLTGSPALQAVIADAGFSRYAYDPFSRQLQPLSAATQSGSGHNQLWIRDLLFVQQRCRPAPPVRVGRVSL